VLHAALRGPVSLKEWGQQWQSKAWPAAPLRRYFADKKDRFDLVDGQYPFFQRTGFKEGKRVGANKLAAEITETSVELFSHVSDDVPPVLPNAEVARQLIAHQLTTGQGGRGYGANLLSRGAVVLAEEHDLFETLHLNLIRYMTKDNDSILNLESDAPAWETNSNPCAAANTPDGLLDLYTWQSHSIFLISEPDK
jgi:CRISPR type I-E-associated protein CasA/Cse1